MCGLCNRYNKTICMHVTQDVINLVTQQCNVFSWKKEFTWRVFGPRRPSSDLFLLKTWYRLYQYEGSYDSVLYMYVMCTVINDGVLCGAGNNRCWRVGGNCSALEWEHHSIWARKIIFLSPLYAKFECEVYKESLLVCIASCVISGWPQAMSMCWVTLLFYNILL